MPLTITIEEHDSHETVEYYADMLSRMAEDRKRKHEANMREVKRKKDEQAKQAGAIKRKICPDGGVNLGGGQLLDNLPLQDMVSAGNRPQKSTMENFNTFLSALLESQGFSQEEAASLLVTKEDFIKRFTPRQGAERRKDGDA